MSNPEKLAIVPGKTDADKAADLKAMMAEALTGIGKIMDEAQDEGFQISFGLGKDYRGCNIVTMLQIAKVY